MQVASSGNSVIRGRGGATGGSGAPALLEFDSTLGKHVLKDQSKPLL